MNPIDVLTKEAEGMRAALVEIDHNLLQAQVQRANLSVLLGAVEKEIARLQEEPVQLELDLGDKVVSFPTPIAN
jgi:uncharacterized coiled-coil DUF342 family protein